MTETIGVETTGTQQDRLVKIRQCGLVSADERVLIGRGKGRLKNSIMARGKELLTAAEVRAARAPAMLHDGRGLYLQVEAASDPDAPPNRSWVFRFTSPHTKQRRWMSLGRADAGAVSLKAARLAADACRRQLDAGIDPIDQRRRERDVAADEAAHARTFKQAALEYLETKRSEWASPKYRKLWLATLESYVFPQVGALPVSALDTSRNGMAYVKRILSAKQEDEGNESLWIAKPETARKIRQRCEAVLEYASAHGYRGEADNPFRLGRVQHIMGKSPRDVRHMPALPFDEVGDFMSELRKLDGLGASALQLTILCATRTTETLGARWTEFDLEARRWVVPAARMKGRKGQRREHRIPLSRQAVRLLRDLREADPKGVFVFPGLGTGSHLSGMAMLKVLERMKRQDITVHGFRSTFRDWAAERTNFPREVAEQALAHTVEGKTEAAYRRGDALEKREKLMQAWADFCDAAQVTGAVVNLKAKRGGG